MHFWNVCESNYLYPHSIPLNQWSMMNRNFFTLHYIIVSDDILKIEQTFYESFADKKYAIEILRKKCQLTVMNCE